MPRAEYDPEALFDMIQPLDGEDVVVQLDYGEHGDEGLTPSEASDLALRLIEYTDVREIL